MSMARSARIVEGERRCRLSCNLDNNSLRNSLEIFLSRSDQFPENGLLVESKMLREC